MKTTLQEHSVELYEALRKLVDDCPHQMRMNYQQRSKGEAIELLSNLKEAYEEAKKKGSSIRAVEALTGKNQSTGNSYNYEES